MQTGPCVLRLNDKGQELTAHGTLFFPCGCYWTNLDATVTGDIPWHWHEEMELIIIQKGAATITAGSMKFDLKEGEGAFINSNVIHSGLQISAEKCHLHSFVFHANLVCGSSDNIYMQKYISPLMQCPDIPGLELKNDTDWHAEILQCMQQAYTIFQAESFGFEFSIRDLLSKICLSIVEHNQQLLSFQSDESETTIKRVKNMLDFIHHHYSEPLDLIQIASNVNISRRECLRCFQEILCTSPMQYLIKHRISSSAHLLRESSLNITEICTRCGFTSPSYFSKMFKRYLGCSPKEYRNGIIPLVGNDQFVEDSHRL